MSFDGERRSRDMSERGEQMVCIVAAA